MSKGAPWKTELVEGDPIQVGKLQLTPVVRVRSIVQRHVTFGTSAAEGGGGGLMWLQPVTVIERRPDGSEKYLEIVDRSWSSIRGMLIGAATLPAIYLFCASVAYLVRRRRKP